MFPFKFDTFKPVKKFMRYINENTAHFISPDSVHPADPTYFIQITYSSMDDGINIKKLGISESETPGVVNINPVVMSLLLHAYYGVWVMGF